MKDCINEPPKIPHTLKFATDQSPPLAHRDTVDGPVYIIWLRRRFGTYSLMKDLSILEFSMRLNYRFDNPAVLIHARYYTCSILENSNLRSA